MTVIANIEDRRAGTIGPWATAPMIYRDLEAADIGRTVIYLGAHRREAGTLAKYDNGIVYLRFRPNEAAMGCRPQATCFGLRAVKPGETVDRPSDPITPQGVSNEGPFQSHARPRGRCGQEA